MAPPKILVVDDNPELLSLMTELIQSAGYTVLAASKGKQALDQARTGRPSLALIDVLLPDMMGFQLTEQLRKEQPNLPVIFVTGVFKGGKQAAEARQKYGAVAYFEKPFQSSKLLEAISGVVQPGKKGAESEDPFDVELDIDVEEDLPQEAMELTGFIRVSGDGSVKAELQGEKLTASVAVKGQDPTVRPPPPGIPKPSGPTRKIDPLSRRGDLSDNLPALITAFYLSQGTGELGIQRGKVKKVLYFEHGQPVFALSNLLPDRFGQFLVRVGKIKAEDLRDAAAVANASKRRTGDVLVERGLLKDTERLYYVGQQVKSIIYSLFGWEDGAYVMTFREKAVAESIKLDIHPANLIVRGVKKLYKPERLHRIVAADDRFLPSAQAPYPLNEIQLDRWEAELLPRVDGTRTASELVRLANRPENVVYAFLCALVSMGMLERAQ